jgi:uncharacterized protein YaiE (UPF0345 family)
MQKYVNDITTVVDGKLEPLSNAAVTVYVGGTSTLATLYSDNGITTTTNPFISSNTGRVAFYADDGRYDLVVSKAGYNSVSIPDIIFDDPAVYTGPTSIVVNNAVPALTINQQGTGPALAVEGAGKIGIGTTTPTQDVHISREGSAIVEISNSTDLVDLDVRVGTVTTTIGNVTSHPLTFITANTERMRIGATGNVGIGATNPVSPLQVTGVASFSDGTAALPSIANTGDLNTGIFFPAADTIAFSTGGAEEMRITSTGNVGIGNNAPTSTLDLVGNYSFGAPVTKTANFTVGDAENFIICNGTATITVTLPDAATYPGRIINIKNNAAFTVISASSNVKPRTGTVTTAGTSILLGTVGLWATLVSDGSFWIVMAGN